MSLTKHNDKISFPFILNMNPFVLQNEAITNAPICLHNVDEEEGESEDELEMSIGP